MKVPMKAPMKAPMKVIEDMGQWCQLRAAAGGSVGLVATMGALHDGHASLLRRSVLDNDLTVLSIYVNPTQFNDPNDLADYPQTLSEDLAIARQIGVDYVILPRYEDMYADGYRFQINETRFSDQLCGGNRPGHFSGVLTVVMKLLNLVQPQRAYFGEKDYQQYLLIKDMAAAFFMDVEIVRCATVRECDGLAMSSRNKLLTPGARKLAGKFNLALQSSAADEEVKHQLCELGFAVDYIVTLAIGEANEEATGAEVRRFGAVVLDCGGHTVRLIDNVEVLDPGQACGAQTASGASA